MAADESTTTNLRISAMFERIVAKLGVDPQENILSIGNEVLLNSDAASVLIGHYKAGQTFISLRATVGQQYNHLISSSLFNASLVRLIEQSEAPFRCFNTEHIQTKIDPDLAEIMGESGHVAIRSEQFNQTERMFLLAVFNRSMIDQHELNELLTGALMMLIREEKLLQKEQLFQDEFGRYKAVFDHSNDGILIIDNQNVIIQANAKAFEIFGYSKDDFIGKRPQDLSPTRQADGELSDEKAQRVIREALEGIPQRFFWQHLKSDGSVFDLEISLGTSKNESGRLIYAMLRDMTNQKILERALTEAKVKAEEADQLKSAFLANMSHEIRTPLNAIIGFSEILMDAETSVEEKNEYTYLIHSAGKTLQQLIDDIIDISKIEAGQIRISKLEVDIHQVLDELLFTFTNLRNNQQKSHVELRLNKALRKGALLLETDPFRFKQIVSNLLSNALKFVDLGFIEFGYTASEASYVQFYVKDTGVGIEREKAHLIFERFGQIDSTYKRNLSGTGLGLAISKSLIELLGGKIWFDSEAGKGTTFYFTLPLKQHQSQIFASNQSQERNDWSDKVFLVVDDVQANFIFLKAMFKEANATVLWAKNGREAIDLAQKAPRIDLVLMDIRMPEMDGYEASSALRKLYPDLMIVAQTAFSEPEDFELAMQSGCNEYITKPISYTELFSLVTKLIK